MRILIADDEEVSRTVIKGILTKLGHEVEEHRNGQSVESLIFEGRLPQILILDWMMPGLTGPQICEAVRLQKNLPYIHIIILTTKTERDDVITALRSGANDFIVKPIGESELRSRLQVAEQIVNLQNLVSRQREQIIAASKLSLLGQMAGGVAHEINNPLAIIKTNLDLLRLKNPSSSSAPFDTMDRAFGRIKTVLDSLRDFSSDDLDTQFEDLRFEDVLAMTMNLLGQKIKNRGVELRLDLKHQSLLRGNRIKLCQVLMTLLQNALGAMSAHGSPWIRIETSEDATRVLVAVSDNGRAMPIELRRQILEPYFFTSELGRHAGLTLGACRGIIEAHKGTIAADELSAENRFVVAIPKSEAEIKPQKS